MQNCIFAFVQGIRLHWKAAEYNAATSSVRILIVCCFTIEMKQQKKICEMLWNWTGMDKGKKAGWKPREYLSGTLKRQLLKDVTFHTPSHTWNTAAHVLFMSAVSEWKGCCFEPFPAVILWVKEEKKAPDAHFT